MNEERGFTDWLYPLPNIHEFDIKVGSRTANLGHVKPQGRGCLIGRSIPRKTVHIESKSRFGVMLRVAGGTLTSFSLTVIGTVILAEVE
jgi:hypothetical protein